MVMFGSILFSTLALLPPMLQHLFGYTVIGTGLVLMPRGIGSILSTFLGGMLMRRGVDVRLIMGTGLLITAWTLYEMAQWSLEVDSTAIILLALLQGLGFGLVFIPINILAFATLSPQHRTEASSIMNLFRSVGSSIGISAVTVALARNTQISHADLAPHITGESGGAIIDFSAMERFQQLGESVMTMVNGEVTRQASMIAFVNDYYIMMWMALAALPMLLFLKPPKAQG